MKSVLRALAAVLAVPVSIALFLGSQTWNVYLIHAAFLYVLAPAIVLGLPLGLLFLKLKWNHGAVALVTGFAIGVIVAALLVFGLSGGSGFSAVNDVATIIDGKRTLAGWLLVLKFAISIGAWGALGGVAAWAVWNTATTFGRARAWFLALAIASAFFSVVPYLALDRTCHDAPWRGQGQADLEFLVNLRVLPGEWPAVETVMKDFAEAENWSFENDSQNYRAASGDFYLRTLDLSVCTDDGTTITAGARSAPGDPAGEDVVNISVYRFRDGDRWHAPVRTLIHTLVGRWPGKLQFRGPDFEKINPPEFLELPDNDASASTQGEP